MNQFLHSLAKKYQSLPSEFKIPASILLLIIIFFLKIFDLIVKGLRFLTAIAYKFLHTAVNISRRLPKSLRNIVPASLKIKTLRYLNRRHRHRNHKSKHRSTLTIIPLVSKLKYFTLGIFFSFIFIFLPLVSLIFIQELPNPRELSMQRMPQTTKIYDRNKVLLYEIYTNENRTLVSLEDIPQSLRQATLAIEDKNFYKHPGFDITSIVRALKENITNGKSIQGGSTITQQLIKSSFFTSEKKISRKIKEIILAFWAERIYSKDKILEMYFNQVPYGGTAWGAEAASEVYFGKKVSQLSLAESAFLAGLTQAPSAYSPYVSDPSRWKNRQKDVLNRMVALGYISGKQAKQAERERLAFKPPREPLLAPHFVMYVKDLLISRHGLAAVEKGGLSVITSLDIKKQNSAQQFVKEEVDNDAYLNLTNGAALVTNPKNGDILAMIGSKEYNNEDGGNFNVTTSLRQPGSTVKAITYSAALMKGLTPASMIDDAPAAFNMGNGVPPYTPVNYDGKYFGRVSLRFALANSLNLPAVKTLQRIGVPAMVNLGREMGITSWEKPELYGLSVTLGSAETTMLDMATVFGTLSNKGQRVDLNPILLVTDAKGNILEQKENITETPVLSEGISYIITDILSDNQTRSAVFGPNSELVIPGKKVAVKTGTSDEKRDNWAIGYTDNYVVTVWVGNNNNSPMNPMLASGITGAAPIWHKIMVNILGDTPEKPRQIPGDIVAKQCYGKTEYFLKGTENSVNCGNNPTAKFYPAN